MRGRTLLYREAFSLAPPFEEIVMEDSGGEAASLREAPLPQTPSPEERMAFEVRLSPYNMRLRVGRVSSKLGCGHGG